MKMKIFLLVLCVFISHAVGANNLTKPNFTNNSSQDESKDENLNLTEEENPSANSEPGNNIIRNLFSTEIPVVSPGLSSLNEPDCNDANNNPQTSRFPNQYRVESPKGQSSYKRVFVGKDSSGSEIYTSSSKMEHAVSLAENIRVVGAGLKILKNRGDVQTMGRRLANPSCESPPKKNKSLRTKHGKRTKLIRDCSNCSECEAASLKASSICLSRQMILSPELRYSYEKYMLSHREALNMVSLDECDECAFLENEYRLIDFELPGPSGLSMMRSDAFVSEHAVPYILPCRPPSRQELSNEFSNSISDQDSSTRLEVQYNNDIEARFDNSLNQFVAAVNALMTLVEGLDQYFGSARRLRTSILEQPQESFNILEEISSFLKIMTILSRPLGVGRLDTDSENRLIDVSDTVVYVNEEIWCHMIDFRNNEERDDDSELVEYLLAILREFRNEVTAVIESARPVMEYFQKILNIM